MLRVELDGPVMTLALDRPEARNALNDELIAALLQAIDQIPPAVRVVVIAGMGDAFCSGGDLEWMRRAATYTKEENERDALKIATLFQKISTLPAAVIARIQGPAFGGGCGLIAACDVALSVPEARFAFSEVRLGLVPATISPVVVAKIGPGQARALFATGESFDSSRALRIGLIHEVVGLHELDGAMARVIDGVLASGPLAVASAKKIAAHPPESPEAAAKLLAETRAGEEAVEGVGAFLDKRRAAYVVRR